MADAIDNFLGNESGNSPADMFSRKLRAVTGSAATSTQAAMRARQNTLSMISRFGNPGMFFTMSPNDLHSFRIMVMGHSKWGRKDPPNVHTVDSETLKKFAMDSANTRRARKLKMPRWCDIHWWSFHLKMHSL